MATEEDVALEALRSQVSSLRGILTGAGLAEGRRRNAH